MIARILSAAGLWLCAGWTIAFAEVNGPRPWQLGLQDSATRMMDEISWFNDFTLVIVTLIALFVLALITICIVRFRASANPDPSRVTHNTLLEVAWTVIPIFILVIIAVPSFKLLYAQYNPGRLHDEFDPATTKVLTVKAIGNQWNWDYEYTPDSDNESFGVANEIYFTSIMVPEDELQDGDVRLLSVDNEMVVPVGTFVRMLVTADVSGVIHAFAVPAFGIKMDAVPGRLNETWFKAEREGLYYGQCSELCGKDHAFMPIAVRVVSTDQFAQWATAAADDVEAANEMLAGLIDEAREQKLASSR